MTTEAWPFPERFKEFMMPPTQIREAIKRLQKKGAEIAADNEENLNVIKAVHQAYANKKSRARIASTKLRAAKSAAEEEEPIEVELTEEAACEVAEVVAEAAPPTPAEPEPTAAAPPTKAASKAAKTRADNVAPEAVPKKPVEPPAPAPKRAASEAAPRRRGGLCGMVASISSP